MPDGDILPDGDSITLPQLSTEVADLNISK